MVRISLDLGVLNLKEVVLILLMGWGLFVLATAAFFLLRYQVKKLDETEVLRWQGNWERKHGHRRPIRDFAIVFLKGAKQIKFASYLFGGSVLAGLIFLSLTLLRILATKAHHLLQDPGVVTSIWAVAVVDFGVLFPSYLSARMIAGGLRSVGEKIVMLAANLDTREE